MEAFDYKIETITDSEYSLSMEFKAKSRLINRIFQLAKKKLHKQYKLKTNNIKGKPQDLKQFDVPLNYHNLIKTATLKGFNLCKDNFRKDRIELTTHEVESAKFINKGEFWVIRVIFTGFYIDKRNF